MRILVIGSRGFIGSQAFSHFRSQPGFQVAGADILPASEDGYYSLNPERPDWEGLISDYQPDLCLNAAGSADVSFSLNFPERDRELNAGLLERIGQAIRIHASQCRLLNFSSAAVYGNPRRLPIKESDALNPISPYGRHKLESEEILSGLFRDYGIPTLSMRVFSVYGPGLRKQLLWDIYQKSKTGNLIELSGTGKETRDFIFIGDLLRALDIILARVEFKGQALNVSSGKETSIAEISGELARTLGREIRFSGRSRPGDPLHWKADISVLLSMGFKPITSVETGVRAYAAWLKGLK